MERRPLNTSMSDIEYRLTRLEEIFGNIPARHGASPPPPEFAIYQTAAGDGSYPTDASSNVYFAYRCFPSYPKQIGENDLDLNVSSDGSFIENLGLGYIPEGTPVICEFFNGQPYCWVDGPQMYFGDGDSISETFDMDTNPTGVTVTDLLGDGASSGVSIGCGDDAWLLTGQSE
jgi:hypothetical protein